MQDERSGVPMGTVAMPSLSEPFRKSCSLSCSSRKPAAKLWPLIRREPQWAEVTQSFSLVFAA
jgi:hypothetical protein